VLDDPRDAASAQAIGIAERLGVAFRRIPLTWNWMAHVAALSRRGSLMGLAQPARSSADGKQVLSAVALGTNLPDDETPSLVISAGARAAAVALWLKARFGCPLVHCTRPGLGGMLLNRDYDLLVVSEHDQPAPAPNLLSVLGVPHRASPLLLYQQAQAWRERLAHLPHPRVALLVGGPERGTDMPPALAHSLARRVARLTAEHGGTVLATTSQRTGTEATEALAAGLSRVLHVLYRYGEPDDNPYYGFLGGADVIVVTADSATMISEACTTTAAVYVALPELAGLRQRRLLASLFRAGQARPFDDDLFPWPRTPIDEAERVARVILERFVIE
jgi:hypothetical protein